MSNIYSIINYYITTHSEHFVTVDIGTITIPLFLKHAACDLKNLLLKKTYNNIMYNYYSSSIFVCNVLACLVIRINCVY